MRQGGGRLNKICYNSGKPYRCVRRFFRRPEAFVKPKTLHHILFIFISNHADRNTPTALFKG